MLQQKSLKFVKYFFVLFLVSILIFIFSFLGYLSPVEGVLSKISTPFVSVFNNASLKLKDIGSSIAELGSLQKENKELKKKVEELTFEVSRLSELKIENESLKKQLGFINSTNFQTVAARVIAKEPSNFLKIIVIDKGSKDGIKKNLAVVSGGFLLGRIQEVNSDTSKVVLLMDSNFQISGMVQERSALGLVKGQIGSGAVMEEISKEKLVKNGDTVVTSNLENEVPENLLIGKITDISVESNGLFLKASVLPFVNFDEARNVVVILGVK